MERNRPLNQQVIEDLEKTTTLEYAKENGLWIDDFYSLGTKALKGGYENTLVLDHKNVVVYKSNNLMTSKQIISNLLESIDIHNQLFPETKYDIVGFTGIDNGTKRTPYIEVILKQDYKPNATQASFKEIKTYMESLGFKQTTPESYLNKNYLVFDLYPRNVLKDENGVIYVVDAEFKRIL
jgi:Serine/Threonine/Tyrosine Kinase found in polyvalent proteins